MALGTPVFGTPAYTSTNGSPAYPAGVGATGKLYLIVAQKPSAAGGGTVTTPAGWTLKGETLNKGGYGTTIGADVGNLNLRIYERAAASQAGTQAVSTAGSSVCWMIIGYVSGTIDSDELVFGEDTSGGSVSAALPAVDLAAGDSLIWGMAIPTDVTTPSQFSAHALAAAGLTLATATEVAEPDNATGNDIGGFIARSVVNSGAATVAPTVSATATGTTTNVRGPVFLLRIREGAAAVGLVASAAIADATDVATGSAQASISIAGVTADAQDAASGSVSSVVAVAAAIGDSTDTVDGALLVQSQGGVNLDADIVDAPDAVVGTLAIEQLEPQISYPAWIGERRPDDDDLLPLLAMLHQMEVLPWQASRHA